jgi:hypothetical protein
MHHLSNNKKNNDVLITAAATLVALATIIVVIVSGGAITPATATPTSNSSTTGTANTPSGVELSPQPVWKEQATTSAMTPINQTHSIVTFIGNGTLIVPGTGQTINMTNNGIAFISPVTGLEGTVATYGKENVFSSDDGDKTAITFHEIIRYDPTTFQGKGTVIAVFDANATGSLAPFNGMFVIGTHEEDPNVKASTITLWEWQSAIPLPSTTTTMEQGPSLANTNTTTGSATASDTNATSATGDETVEEEAVGGAEVAE